MNPIEQVVSRRLDPCTPAALVRALWRPGTKPARPESWRDAVAIVLGADRGVYRLHMTDEQAATQLRSYLESMGLAYYQYLRLNPGDA